MISNNDCWDAKDKKIINLKRAECNAEAVTLGQMTDITNEKLDTNNLLTQTLKSRLVFTYLVISIYNDHDIKNKKFISSWVFSMDLSNSLTMIDFLFFWEYHAIEKCCEIIWLVSYSNSMLWYYKIIKSYDFIK